MAIRLRGIHKLAGRIQDSEWETLQQSPESEAEHMAFDAGFRAGVAFDAHENKKMGEEDHTIGSSLHTPKGRFVGMTTAQAMGKIMEERKNVDTWDRQAETREAYAIRMKGLAICLAKGIKLTTQGVDDLDIPF